MDENWYAFPNGTPPDDDPGMSLRAWLAGQALGIDIGTTAPAAIARYVVAVADAVIAQLDAKQEPK